jgi:hypothetical protein
MVDQKQYRILTPDGRLSHDTFVVASEQPSAIQQGCVLVVNDRDGTQLTTHRDRLFSVANAGEPKKVCLKCGRVLGVVEDQVQCPYDEGSLCELIEPPDGFPATQVCAEHSP